ncbi:LysR substrate-binding domain-containing protein [Nitrobacter sp.]|uniref:LysR substrate-binding domain-containing protein n=1 Tax=Nitrobacter sp. TaxID=29420 RepID=UPI0029CAC5F7|nr:LysR substrate-binding domain-containing protein [Nitrobacter sp.]
MTMLREVADKGSFTAAARKLEVPVSTLSRKVSELEVVLGTTLLTRTTRKITLTDAGFNYLAAARRILEDIDEAERRARGEFIAPKGELVLTAPIHFGRLHVLPIVREFLSLYPEISIRLVLTDRNVDLLEDRVDMAVRIGELGDSSLIGTKIGAMRTVVTASPVLLASRGVPQSPEDLLNYPCITIDLPMPSTGWRFKPAGSRRVIDVPVLPRLAITTTEAAVLAAVDGVGIARTLCYQVADPIAADKLKLILRDFEPELAPIHLIHGARGAMPMKMRTFLDFATPRFRNGLRDLDA